MNRLLGILGTILVHLIFLLAILSPSCQTKAGSPPPPPNIVEVRLIPKPDPLKAPIEKVEQGDTPKEVAITNVEQECGEHTYEGVGMIWNESQRRVLSVGEGYPAHRAGIRQGDIIANPEGLTRDKSYMDIVVLRGNERLEFRVPIEKICYDEMHPDDGR